MKLAISGKGGVGKTTLSALLAQYYADQGEDVLAVDGDPSPCLAGALGLPDELRAKLHPIAEMDELRGVFEIREPIPMEVGDGSLITIVPDKKFRVSCTQVGPAGRDLGLVDREAGVRVDDLVPHTVVGHRENRVRDERLAAAPHDDVVRIDLHATRAGERLGDCLA